MAVRDRAFLHGALLHVIQTVLTFLSSHFRLCSAFHQCTKITMLSEGSTDDLSVAPFQWAKSASDPLNSWSKVIQVTRGEGRTQDKSLIFSFRTFHSMEGTPNSQLF